MRWSAETPRRRLGHDELHQLMNGASVLGTGGGGSLAIARTLVDEILSSGIEPELIGINELSSEALGVTTACLGGGLTHEEVCQLTRLPAEPIVLEAAREIEKKMGKTIEFVYAVEIGPQNTMEAIRLAALLGVPIVNGDCAGRAVPQMDQTTLSLFGIPLPPYVISTFQGDRLIVSKVEQDSRNEVLCRAVASASRNLVCVTGFPVQARTLTEALIPGTLQACIEIGAMLGADVFESDQLAERFSGRVAFTGQVTSYEVSNRNAFFYGRLELQGVGPNIGHQYVVGYQNEFLWSWLDSQLDIACPELICVLDSVTGMGKVTYGHGFENSIQFGDQLTVVQLPCAEVWRSSLARSRFPQPPRGLDLEVPVQ